MIAKGCATIAEGSTGGFASLTLTSPDGRLSATFLPSLNMLCSSLVHDGDELLHLRAGIHAYAERGKTCGIPLLHPWANRLSEERFVVAGRTVTLDDGAPLSRDASGLPIHGLLGGRTAWEVTSTSATTEHAALDARFEFDRPALLQRFPFPHTIAIRAVVRNGELRVATSVEPRADAGVPVSFGFHPYFRIPGVPRDEWIVTLPVRQQIVVDSRGIPTRETRVVHFPRAPLGDRTFDDGYADLAPPRVFAIEAPGRRTEVEFASGYAFAQLFAPEGADFLAIEPMTAATDALVAGSRAGLRMVEPGSVFQAEFVVRTRTDAAR